MSNKKYDLFDEDNSIGGFFSKKRKEDKDSFYGSSKNKGYGNNQWDDDRFGGGFSRSYGGGNYYSRDYDYFSYKNSNSVIKQGLTYHTEKMVNNSNKMLDLFSNKREESYFDIKEISSNHFSSYNFFKNLQVELGKVIARSKHGSGISTLPHMLVKTKAFLGKLGSQSTQNKQHIQHIIDHLCIGHYPNGFESVDLIIRNKMLLNGDKPDVIKAFTNEMLSVLIEDLQNAINGEMKKNSSYTGSNSWQYDSAKNCLNMLHYIYVVGNKFINSDDIQMFGQDYFKNFNKEEVDFKIKEDNQWWFNILSNTDNYIMKMLTKGNEISANVVANNMTQSVCKSIYQHVSRKMAVDPNYNPEDFKNDCGGGGGGSGESQEGNGNGQPQSGEGEGNGNSSSGNAAGKNQMDNSFKDQLQQNADQAMEDSKEEIKEKNSAMNMMGIDPSKATAEEMKDVEEILKEIENVKLDKKDIERFIKTSIKNFNSTFRGQKHITEESFLEADEVDDLRDLHHLVDLSLIEDMSVNTNRFSMKYNLYVDCSGSMDDYVSVSPNAKGRYKGGSLQRITLAKILAYKMNKMNLLNEIRGFEGRVWTEPIKNIISQLKANGGTSIDAVISHISKTGIPSIILSDGCDRVNINDPNAYVFTISDTCYGKGLAEIVKDGRAIHFENGQFIKYEIDKNGEPTIDRNKVIY